MVKDNKLFFSQGKQEHIERPNKEHASQVLFDGSPTKDDHKYYPLMRNDFGKDGTVETEWFRNRQDLNKKIEEKFDSKLKTKS